MSIDRRRFLARSVAGVASAALANARVLCAADQSVAVGSEPQILIDDWAVQRADDLKRTLHQPRKQGLIKEADGSDWQRGGVYLGNAVCRDNAGIFHMTYRYYWWDAALEKVRQIGVDKAHWFHETVGYATSDDGIRWSKPELGRFDAPSRFSASNSFPFETPEAFSRRNNFGYPIPFAYDLQANGNVSDPNKRFLFQVVEQRDATHPFAKPLDSQLYFAADWPDIREAQWKDKLTPIPKGTLSPRGFSTICGYDYAAKEWFMTCQDVIQNWLKRDGRDIARYASPDLVSWTGPELVLPVAQDESRKATDHIEYMDLWGNRIGGPRTGAWLGQLLIFHSDRTNPEYQTPRMPNVWRKGTTELRLVISRDAGRSWQRVGDHQAWLPHHDEDDGFDRLINGTCPVRVGDEMRYYYSCWNGDHLVFNRDGSTHYPNRLRNNCTAWATLRINGQCSLDANDQGGQLLTKPLRFDNSLLAVNLSAAKGSLRVEVQDDSGNPVEGFASADCVPATGDGLALPVQWRDNRDLRKLAGRAVRLRFELRRGSLYAFQFV